MLSSKKHTNLRQLDDSQRSWSFLSATDADDPKLADLSCIELRLEGLHVDRSRDENDTLKQGVYRRLDEIIWALAQAIPTHAYLLAMSHLAPRNKVRSYKGIFPLGGEIRGTDFHQAEIERGKDSFFLGVAKMCARNKNACFSLAHSPSHAFILFSKVENSEAVWQGLKSTFTEWVQFQSRSVVTTWKLIPKTVQQDAIVVRFNRDFQGGNWISVMLFVPSVALDKYLRELELVETVTP